MSRGACTTTLTCSVFVIFTVFVLPCSCLLFALNSNDLRSNHTFNQRSNSTTGRVVKLLPKGTISFTFCLRENTTVLINRVRYSNDGIPDHCMLSLDNFALASFATKNWTGWGEMWNVFENAVIRRGLVLNRGMHVMKLDMMFGDGVEIDEIELAISDTRLTKEMLDCQLLCQATGPVFRLTDTSHLPQYGLVSQSSYPTKCAEEDNINIPLVLHGILEYSITATLPTYRTFANRREENTTGCSFLPHVYWTFKDITLPSKIKLVKSGSATLSIFSIGANYHFSQSMSITFNLFGRSMGHIDAEIGSIFTIAIQPVNRAVEVRLVLTGRSKHTVILNSQYFMPGERIKRFDIPDFTWTEEKINSVTVTFNSYAESTLTVTEMQLERRAMKPEITETIYKDDEMVIDAVYLDFWWRAPESMTISIGPNRHNKQVFPNVAYFRVSRPIPWTTGSYAQIFVLYQDGNARLLQLPPPGLDWVPFGSSVILGATNPKSHRPSAPILEVQINPPISQFKLLYADGSTAEFRLSSTIEETEIVVKNLEFTKDMAVHPFATFRSMYVEEGNSDCDSLMIDGKKIYHIMDQWMPKDGRSFMFYRRCESKHLTLSPDIRLTVRRAQAGSMADWWSHYLNSYHSAGPSLAQFKRYSSSSSLS